MAAAGSFGGVLTRDGGTSWTPLGSGTRVGSTANWQLTGLSLPATGQDTMLQYVPVQPRAYFLSSTYKF